MSGIAPLLPTAGEWAVYNNGTTDLSVTVLDARDASSVQTYQKPGYVTVTHTAPTVSAGPASTAGLAGNVQAKYRLLINDSSNNIYLNMGGTAVVNTGVRLNSGGGSLELYGRSMFYGDINFISSNAGDVLLCTESE